ncbi:LysR family transcriptional regulator [Paraburkholderia sp. GAS334]|uniref:LysR family transcriptional regulator n=1 Tax=Paraburkholderia sp. GAS334 TaxID=3035131 RepID=UPI003D23110A
MKNVDLHLIAIFDAVMTEGSITKAAARLAITQSAVSNAVARMRLVWNDPLFIRAGRGIKPSAKAEALWRDIEGPLASIRMAAAPTQFDPSTSTHTFRLALTDYLSGALWPPLRRYIEAQAPGISLYAVPYTSRSAQKQLTDNEIDICFSGLSEMGNEIRLQRVFVEDWICAMRRDHQLAKSPLTEEAFLSADHLLVSLSGNPVGVVDATLDRLGKRRKVAVTLNNFGGVPPLLLASDLICVLPAGVIRTHALRDEVHTCRVPFDMSPFHCQIAWHARNDREAAHRWMRALVAQMCNTIWGTGTAS